MLAVAVDDVLPLFPGAHRENVAVNLPRVLQALDDQQLCDPQMVRMALGTIRAECAGFAPLSEGVSRFNTSPGGHPFDLYDSRADLGNAGPPDGSLFKGRGFVQLTGRANYIQHGRSIGRDLVANPELANDPIVAAQLLASFLKANEQRIRAALTADDLAPARRAVNGGSHGLDAFTDTYRRGATISA